MSKTINITLPYQWKPRDYQKPLWGSLRDGARRSLSCWHRRSGKDDVYLHHNACAAHERVGNYWYLLPKYEQCRKAIWTAINPHTGRKRIDEAFPEAIRKNTLQQEMKIEFHNGSTFQLMGSDNYDSLVGSPPVGLTFSEYALSDPSSWGLLRPILLENNGWAAFNSTPRGKNHFYKMLQMAGKSDDWFSEVLTNKETGVFTDAQLLNELKELQSEHGDAYGKALWLQEYFCSFEAALPGSVWGESIAEVALGGRICEVGHTEGFPVFTSWDIGRSDSTSVWFYQVIANEIRVIDFFEDNFKEIPFYAEMLRKKTAEFGYVYGCHWVPHDAIPKRMGMGGKSILQQFIEENVGDFAPVPNLSKEDGHQAGRATFHKAYFDAEKCDEGLEHLKSYRREYDQIKKDFSKDTVHDEHSHAADSWRYLSLTWRRSTIQMPDLTQSQRFKAGNIRVVNFGEIKKAHFDRKRREREE